MHCLDFPLQSHTKEEGKRVSETNKQTKHQNTLPGVYIGDTGTTTRWLTLLSGKRVTWAIGG